MARSVLALVLTSLLPVIAATAEPPPLAPPAPDAFLGKGPNPPPPDATCPDRNSPPRDADPMHRPPAPPPGEESLFQGFQKRLEKMGPEERERFKENWKRWKEMGDRERKAWQQRAVEERDRVKKVIDDAIAKTGLSLNEDQKEVFILRYRQERRKIEEQLREEVDAKRRQKIDEMLERLKSEFSAAKPASASESKTSSSPAPTP
ncbi:MAG: hypothetical protein PHC88_03530 [Terrimicrobiaceae bacterium]|nr:hypothetical protein [Terrimicrobiaceae bacterium]